MDHMQTAITNPHSINCLAFKTEWECVYCTAQTVPLM